MNAEKLERWLQAMLEMREAGFLVVAVKDKDAYKDVPQWFMNRVAVLPREGN